MRYASSHAAKKGTSTPPRLFNIKYVILIIIRISIILRKRPTLISFIQDLDKLIIAKVTNAVKDTTKNLLKISFFDAEIPYLYLHLSSEVDFLVL
jgi:hypothetical protein